MSVKQSTDGENKQTFNLFDLKDKIKTIKDLSWVQKGADDIYNEMKRDLKNILNDQVEKIQE